MVGASSVTRETLAGTEYLALWKEVEGSGMKQGRLCTSHTVKERLGQKSKCMRSEASEAYDRLPHLRRTRAPDAAA